MSGSVSYQSTVELYTNLREVAQRQRSQLIGGFLSNQLEKLEAARVARLVCLSLLGLTGSFLVLLGPSWAFWVNLF